MTDPTPQTTPTRDEAVPTGWRYSINYGPDGEENFANVYAADGQFVGNLRTHHAIAICNAFAVCEKLAYAPAPASGGVDAVAGERAAKIAEAQIADAIGDDDAAKAYRMACHDCAEAIRSTLSPAATPVSEAEPDWMEAQQVRKRRGVEIMQEYAWGNLTPLGVANHLKRAGFNIDYAQKIANDLAKPASSPAPVRPIGNQGISDYQREIARNMAEGFAAWNAARQEALPSDEPTFSPAGGEPTGNSGLLLGEASADDAPCYLSSEPASSPAGGDVATGLRAEIAHDGFTGDIIGRYVTREGKRGAVVQQDGTRVVHVYGEKWLPIETQMALSQSTSAGRGE